MTQQKIKKWWMKQGDLTKSCNVDAKTFRKWGVAPVYRQGNAKYYEVGDVLIAYHRYQLIQSSHAELDDGMIDKDHEEALKVREERIGRQLKNAELLRQQAPITALETALASAQGSIDAILSSIPLHIRRENPEIPAAVITLIDAEIKKAQNIMAQVAPEWSEG